MYIIKKFYQYFIKKFEDKNIKRVKNYLSDLEFEIFLSQSKYDKIHAYEVFEKIEKKYLENKISKIYIKLALMHDVGKEKTNLFLRIMHKLKFKTKLNNHSKKGYLLLKDIDINLAELILKHHDKTEDIEMKIFQGVDDES